MNRKEESVRSWIRGDVLDSLSVYRGIHTAFAWWVSGIPFDMIHGVSNFVLMLVLYKPLRRVLEHCVVRK